MLRDTLLVLAQSIEPHKRRLRLLFALLAIATTVAVIIAPFDQFALLLTGREGWRNSLNLRAILQYDFGVVWYPVVGVFIGSSAILRSLSRRADMGSVWMTVALIPPCAALSVTLWSVILFFSDMNYPGIQMPDALQYSVYALLPALLLLTPILAMYLARWMGLPRLAMSLSATMSLLGWFGVVSSVAAIATDYGEEPKVCLVLSALSLTWGLCTLTAINSCAILDAQGHHSPQSISLKESAINVGAYLSSARNLSVLLLVFLFACINVSFSYLSRVKDLQSARSAFAWIVASSELLRRADSMNGGEANELASKWQTERNEAKFDFLVGRQVRDGIGAMTVSLKLYRVENLISVEDIHVDVVGRGQWTVRFVLNGAIPLSDSVPEQLRTLAQIVNRLSTGLPDIAFRWQIDAPADAPDLIYRRVEREFITREVSLPSVGFGVRSSTAMWWLGFGTLVLLIMVRNQVGIAGRFYSSTRSEPWLVLDLSKGLERVLANLWLWAIFLAPWLVGGQLIMTVNGQVIADGISAPTVPTLVRLGGLVAIPLVGGWVAASLVARLMILRQQNYSVATEDRNPLDRAGMVSPDT